MACRTGCPTKDCPSYAACLKGMNLQIGDLTGQGQRIVTDRRLNAYADARRQGIQPQGTRLSQTQAAVQAAGA